MIEDGSVGWSRAKREAFEEAFRTFLNHVTINSKDTGPTILGESLFDAQERFIRFVFDGLERNVHDFYVLKSRQLGASTVTRAFSVFWLGMHPGLTGAIVFDTDGNKLSARREIENMVRDLPPEMNFPGIKAVNRNGLTLTNQSTILFLAAGVKNSRSSGTLGRSQGLSYGHQCLHPDTPVIVQDGKIKPIKDVVIGDWVVTHSGAMGKVVANIRKFNDRGLLRKIIPWLGDPIYCTKDHKIQTQRGLVKAGELELSDRLIMPVRKIGKTICSSFLPQKRMRTQGGGCASAAAGAEIWHTEEIGYAVGYYLAEGCMTYQRRGEQYGNDPAGIIFTRHRDEIAYADRAIGALRPFTTGARRTHDKPACLTTTENIYGAALAAWVKQNFGAADNKIIPDSVFNWGEDFCRGVLAGLLCGDGSKKTGKVNGKYQLNTVSLTTTRSSIATQIRDLAAALGYGWGRIKYRKSGQYYGRNCKDIWVVTWSGRRAGGLRELMGLEAFPAHNDLGCRYEISGDEVRIRIRKIEDGFESPIVHDLSVDHPDHTFRTPSMAVSNSEMCSWDNPEGLIAYRKALSQINPNRLYIWESTARGYNDWYHMWVEAKADEGQKSCIFLGWWSKPSQKISKTHPDFARYGVQLPTPKEAEKIKQVREQYGHQITPEQLAWIRKDSDPLAKAGEGETYVEYEASTWQLSEQPWTEADAFQQSGSAFFAPEILKEYTDETVRAPKGYYAFATFAEFIDTRVHPVNNARQAHLRVWEDPVDDDAYYVVSADPAFGVRATNDRSALQVLRCYADGCDQVAEYAWPLIGTRQFAWAILAIAAWYAGKTNDVRLIVELNGPGRSVWDEILSVKRHIATGYQPKEVNDTGLRRVFANVKNYIFNRNDSLDVSKSWQWNTTKDRGPSSKIRLMERMRDAVSTQKVQIRSLDLLNEMRGVQRVEESIESMGSNKDDRVLAMALALICWDEKLVPTLSSRKRTRLVEESRRKLTIQDMYSLYTERQFENVLRRRQVDRKAALRQMRIAARLYGDRR